MNENGRLSTTSTSLEILDLVASSEWTTLRDLVDRTGLAKSTVFKHAETLRSEGYLRKHGERYALGLRPLTLGRRAIDSYEPYAAVEQTVRELGNRTDVEVDFTVEDHGRLVLVFEVVGATNESTFGVGSQFPIHTTAAGKAILADSPESRVDELLSDGEPASWNTAQRAEFEAELGRIRDRGYAISDGEIHPGYHSVSSTVTAPDRSVLGAISVGGPTYRLDRTQLHDSLADELQQATSELSETLMADRDYRRSS